jgi:hypothetical protein
VPEKRAISVLLRNQLTHLSVHPPIDSLEDTVGIHLQRYIDEVSNSGGFSLIAHPNTEGIKMFHVKHYPFSHSAYLYILASALTARSGVIKFTPLYLHPFTSVIVRVLSSLSK